jgi:hypothetical protein
MRIAEMAWLHQSLGCVFLAAYLSLYVQYPGLYGPNGLQPLQSFVSWVIEHHLPPGASIYSLEAFYSIPSLLIFASDLNLRYDSFGEFLLLLGIASSMFIALGIDSVLFHFLAWICYLSLFTFGQAFLNFQWDMLLLEVGFLSIFSSLFLSSGKEQTAVRWCYRFLVWKLMFMSGVVKIQANCPTWLGLTALEYHFATQGLPTVLGWYFHQLHPLILRTGVVFTLLVEIPMTFLLISPFQFTRRVGVALQASLQIVILLTGNYNFFNLLTLVLLVPVWTPDQPPTEIARGTSEQTKKESTSSSMSRIYWSVQLLAISAFAVFSLLVMIDGALLPADSSDSRLMDRIFLQIKPSFQIDHYATVGCLFALASCGASLAINFFVTLCHSFRPQSAHTLTQRLSVWIQCCSLIFTTLFAVLYIQCSAIPLSGINVDLRPFLLPQITAFSQSREISSLSLFSGYGLFRTMAGVGQLSETEISSVSQIGGRLPSVVARHEIVLEGYDTDTELWSLIPFKYLPSRTTLPPRWIVPHQPRLDWHMGFAAHGSYQQHPWLVLLIYRLLQGNQLSVISLLDEKNYPFREKPPALIRCLLYEYDLTRLDTYWHMPSSGGVLANESIWSPISHFLSRNESFQWWRRKRLLGDYLTPLHLANPSLKAFLEGNGHQLSSDSASGEAPCALHALPEQGLAGGVCGTIFWARTLLTEESAWSGFHAIFVLIVTRRVLQSL